MEGAARDLVRVPGFEGRRCAALHTVAERMQPSKARHCFRGPIDHAREALGMIRMGQGHRITNQTAKTTG